MATEIFEITIGDDADIHMVTRGGNQISIPNGESLFEKWSDTNRLTHVEREPESDDVESVHREYDKSPELLIEFAIAHDHLWIWDRDRDGILYGHTDEFDSWYRSDRKHHIVYY
jgi:hypothetical protein